MLMLFGLVTGLVAAALGGLFLFGPFRAVSDGEMAPPARPPLDVSSPQAWRTERARLLGAFASEVYGPEPLRIEPLVSGREKIHIDQIGCVEQWRVELGAAGRLHLVLVLPANAVRAPLILVQNFAGNRAAFPDRPQAIAAPRSYYPWICRHKALDPLLKFAFGPYVAGPPFASPGKRLEVRRHSHLCRVDVHVDLGVSPSLRFSD